MIVMGIVIPRSEVDLIKGYTDWILIYGRRKTGKSFLIMKFIEYDEYYFVSRTGKIFRFVDDHFDFLDRNAFNEIIQRDLAEEKTIVIDEFHRLSEEFQDLLQAIKPKSRARLILITSSLFYVEKILGPKSPLLGIAKPTRIDIIKPRDTILALSAYISDVENLLLIAPFAREPLTLSLLNKETSLYSFLSRLIRTIKDIVPALIGEIFFEEGRELSRRYEAILRALSVGNHTPSKIASYISGITGGHLSSSDVKSYLRILNRMGLIRRIKIYNKNKYFYTIHSPLIRAYYYLDEKIGYGEQDIPHEIAISEIKKLLPFFYEELITDFLAEILGGTTEKTIKNEIDGIIKRKKEVLAAVEVKLGTITNYEVEKFTEKLRTKNINTTPIIVAKNKLKRQNIISLEPKDIIEIARKPNILTDNL